MKKVIRRIIIMMTFVSSAILPTTLWANTTSGIAAAVLPGEGAPIHQFLRQILHIAATEFVPPSAHAIASAGLPQYNIHTNIVRATVDMRIRNSEAERSRPDRSVHRDLEDYVATLNGVELVLIVLALVIPVSIATPVMAIILFGGRCDKCGRHHAMRADHHEILPYDGTVTKRGRPVHTRIVTRICRHCGYSDTIRETDH